jgi:YHS domain-containing protein
MRRREILLGAALAALGRPALAEVNTASGVAIGGYDPVAYFTEGRPVRGSRRHRLAWNGALWFFASEEHLEAFAAEPERYAPRYGGFCAYGVAQNYKVKIDPQAWSIVDGRLYLNYDRRVQQTWIQDTRRYIAEADRNWPALDPARP